MNRLIVLLAGALIVCSTPALSSVTAPITVNCAGGADHTNLDDAVTAARNAGGGVILVAKCTYSEPNMVLDSNIHIRGGGDSTVIQSQSGTGDLFTLSGTALTPKSNVTIEDLAIENADTAIRVVHSDSVSLKNLVIRASTTGIAVEASSHVKIADNEVLSNSAAGGFSVGHGIYVYADGSSTCPADGPDMSRFVDITNNTVRRAGQSCIQVEGAHSVSVSRNKLEDCGSPNNYGGVRMRKCVRKFTISDNRILNAGRGLHLISSFDGTITGNVIADSNVQGILLQGNTSEPTYNLSVVGNQIISPATNGIRLATAYRINIAGNHVKDVGNSGNWAVKISQSANAYTFVVGNLFSLCDTGEGAVTGLDSTSSQQANHTQTTCAAP